LVNEDGVALKEDDAAVIVPLTLTWFDAPVVTRVTSRVLRALVVADAFMRTNTSRFVATPPEFVSVTLVPKSALLLVNATENPVGAVTVTLAERLVPCAKKDWGADAVLVTELKAGRLFVLTVTAGGGFVTLPLSTTLLVAPPPESARLPRRLFVAGAPEEMRTTTIPPVEARVNEFENGVTSALVDIS
jgi:hypothetical protein